MNSGMTAIATAATDIATSITGVMAATHQGGHNCKSNERHQLTHGSASYLRPALSVYRMSVG